MSNPIVHVNVSQTQAPIPDSVQKTGAFLSQGGTVLTAGQYSLLTQFSDLSLLFPSPLAISGIAWTSAFDGQVTVTTSSPHGLPVNSQFITTIAGAANSGAARDKYNGTFLVTVIGASTFTYYLVGPDPGTANTGTYTSRSVGDLTSMANTFFSQQGSAQGVFVLELGADATPTVAEGVATLADFIASSPQKFYSYLVPREWDGDPAFVAFLAGFEAPTSKTYFFVTTKQETYRLYAGKKDVMALIEAPFYSVWPASTVIAPGAVWTSGTVTLTTSATDTGVAPGETFQLTGVLPAGYNGIYTALPGTTGAGILFALPANPGTYISGGTVLRSKYSSAGIPATEFSHASDYFVTLNYNPGPANRVPQLAFAYLYGVTPYPLLGNAALIATMDTSSLNYIGTGAEGGQPTSQILFNGLLMDGRPFNYWYAVDWVQINAKLFLANTVINGSNTTLNPLYYNQDGINRLQQSLVGMVGSGITAGLILGDVVQLSLDIITLGQVLSSGRYAGRAVVNAVPFTTYSIANPTHYRLGIYNGLSITFTPLAGFRSITVDINVTDFVG